MTNRRFYKKVEVKADEDGFIITLDDRPLKTPGRTPLKLPYENWAKQVAAEWEAQSETINPSLMPITRLMNVAIEQTPNHRDRLIDEACAYLGTDLLCYRAESPQDLVERQSRLWDPILDWARSRQIDLKTTQGLRAIAQNEEVFSTLRTYGEALGDIELTLWVHLVALYGSTILAMAVMEHRLTAPDAFNLSRLDNNYQIERWGEDEEDQACTEALRTELKSLSHIIKSIIRRPL